MGLDTWFNVKTSKKLNEEKTGVCSGLFGIAPDTSGLYEIGYLRKCWPVTNKFLEYTDLSELKDHDLACCENLKIDLKALPEIKAWVEDLLTKEFDEEGYLISEVDRYCDDCWNFNGKLEDTKEMITKFEELLKEDPEAELYINYWY